MKGGLAGRDGDHCRPVLLGYIADEDEKLKIKTKNTLIKMKNADIIRIRKNKNEKHVNK